MPAIRVHVLAFSVLLSGMLQQSAAEDSDPVLLDRLEAMSVESNEEMGRLLAKWRQSETLVELQDRLQLAVECLCWVVEPKVESGRLSHVQQMIREALSLLREHRDESFPVLLKYVDKHLAGPTSPDRSPAYIFHARHRVRHVCTLLGEFQDRRAILPLIRAFLSPERSLFGTEYQAALTIAKIGDADAVPLLIEAYPFEDEQHQNGITQILGATDSPQATQALIDWSTGNADRAPPYYVRAALIGTGDPSTKDALIELLIACEDIWDRERLLAALERLNEPLDELPIPDWMIRSYRKGSDQRDPIWQAVRFPQVHQGPNQPLREFIQERIREKASQLTAGHTEKNLRLSLIPLKSDFEVGEAISWSLRLTNTGDKPATVLLGRDEWESGTELPRISVEAIGPDHRRFDLVPLCNFYPFVCLQTPRLKQLEVGESCEVISADSLIGFALPRYRPTVPGSYRFKLHYDSTSESSDKGTAHGAAGVRLSSTLVEIRVHPRGANAGQPQETTPKPEIAKLGIIPSYFAWRWNHRDRLSTREARIGAAIHCFRYCPAASSDGDSAAPIGESRAEALAFLRAQPDAATPQLLDVLVALYIRHPAPKWYPSRDFIREFHDLLASAGDRRAALPLVKTLHFFPPEWRDTSARVVAAKRALAELGDAEVIKGLLSTYPYEAPLQQKITLEIIEMTDGCLDDLDLASVERVVLKLLQEEQRENQARLKEWSKTHHVISQPTFPLRYTSRHPELRKYFAERVAHLKRDFREGRGDGGLELQVSVSPPIIELGEFFEIKVSIRNVSNQTRTVMRNRRPSPGPNDKPDIDVEIRGPDHRPLDFFSLGGCDVVMFDQLRLSDLTVIEPGESCDLFGQGAYFNKKLYDFYPGQTGTYHIKVTYNTKHLGEFVFAEGARPPVSVASVDLVSNAGQLQVLSAEQADHQFGNERPSQRNRRAAQWTLALGGAVSVEYGRHFGSGRFTSKKTDLPAIMAYRVVYMQLNRSQQITDDALDHLRGLQHLRHLDLSGSPVTGQGVQRLTGLQTLKHLYLNDTQVKTLTLPPMPSLEVLSVSNTPLTRIKVSDSPKLTHVGLRHTSVLPEDRVALRQLPGKPKVDFTESSKPADKPAPFE